MRPKKRKSYKKCRSVLLTEGGRSQTGVSKTGRLPAPAASESAISSQGRPWEFGWIAVNSVSSEAVDPHMNRTLGNYRTVPGHSCGCVPLCRYARAFSDGSSCGQYDASRKMYPKDERDLFFACE